MISLPANTAAQLSQPIHVRRGVPIGIAGLNSADDCAQSPTWPDDTPSLSARGGLNEICGLRGRFTNLWFAVMAPKVVVVWFLVGV